MTRAERLDNVLKALAPKKVEFFEQHGVWPTQEEIDESAESPAEDAQRGAPYDIRTLSGDRRRIMVIGDEGETISGTGATVEEAMTALEARIA